ncbi:MAG: hypothetical protein GF393_07880, partial [Armatimonadia bacterium]|nr:hypothetical protein [Armatimonadia bacterium]
MILIPLAEITEDVRGQVGGKAWSLATMARAGLTVPDAAVVPADQYRRYVAETGLAQQISLELSRKRFEDMRWEEMWDAALRIRNMFASTPLPDEMRDELLPAIANRFGQEATVVRSSALAEDAAGTSFAGLHESYVNVRGPDEIAEHVRLVWASLWSDAALLYRQELGLDPEESAMGVVIQRIVVGERSGVAFSRAPEEPSRGMIESVWGLNQGLVDGTVEPDRWEIDRESREVLSHTPAEREEAVMPTDSGIDLRPLPEERRASPPLAEEEVPAVHEMSRRTEEVFGAPQDTEWTFSGDDLHTLQSRPITTGRSDDDGSPYSRSWYLSLRRSFDNLQALREKIEGEEIPDMLAEADRLAEVDLAAMSDAELADAIERRAEAFERWHDVYWEDFIPFAHGARLFGQVYNDAMRPEDAYEFIDLLSAQPMVSMQRNRLLEEMAAMVRERDLADALEAGEEPPQDLMAMLTEYAEDFSDPAAPKRDPSQILDLVLQMARREAAERGRRDAKVLEERFLAQFDEGGERERAEELLDLGRSSYRLRDDDNIYLGRVEAEVTRAIAEARSRIERELPDDLSAEDAARALLDPEFTPEPREAEPEGPEDAPGPRGQERQLVGQPAGAGLARGPARVIHDSDELYDFESGEILVIDSLDPTMTFV